VQNSFPRKTMPIMVSKSPNYIILTFIVPVFTSMEEKTSKEEHFHDETFQALRISVITTAPDIFPLLTSWVHPPTTSYILNLAHSNSEDYDRVLATPFPWTYQRGGI
jgi:hypothetical protein